MPTSFMLTPSLGPRWEIVRPLSAEEWRAQSPTYLGRDRSLGRRVYVTLYPPSGPLPPSRDAVQSLASLSHSNLLTVYDFGATDVTDVPYIVTEPFDGRSLDSASHALDAAAALNIVLQVLSALGQAHDRGVLHRAICPAAILLHRDHHGSTLNAKLTHFCVVPSPLPLNAIAYAAPEQLSNVPPPDVRSDIFSIAFVLLELLAARPISRGIQPGWTPTLSESLTPREFAVLPASLRKALSKALAPSPSDRFASITHFATALRACREAVSSSLLQPTTTPMPMSSPPSSPFDHPIARDKPVAIVLLLDQSGSMAEPFGGGLETKKDALALVVNDYLDQLIYTCMRGSATVRDYYHVAVAGYSDLTPQPTSDQPRPPAPPKWRSLLSLPSSPSRAAGTTATVPSLHPDALFSLPSSRLDEAVRDRPTRQGSDGVFTSPIWVKPEAAGGTPMCAALQAALRHLQLWVTQHPGSHPPVVFNVTDGRSTDGDPSAIAQQIKELPALLFTVHITADRATPITFPATEPPDELAKQFWRMSSALPQRLRDNLRDATGIAYPDGTRGYMFNVVRGDDLKLLLRAGTPVPLRS